MKRTALCLISLALVSPTFAQSVTIGETTAGAPTSEQGIECTAYYFTKTLKQIRSDQPALPEQRTTMMAWINYMTRTTGQPQGALMPEINAQKEIIETRLSDPGNPNLDKPYVEKCSAFETQTGEPPLKGVP